MKKTNETNFPYVQANIVRQLAADANCDISYVRKILSGEREANSIKAKAILRAAQIINTNVQKLQNKVRESLVLGEND
jgi:transcriptional regulator with XRE-family HTH domain